MMLSCCAAARLGRPTMCSPAWLTKRTRPSASAMPMKSVDCSTRLASRRAWSSASLRPVMSRPTETSRSGWPSAPSSGEMTTSHHFGRPLWVAQKPSKRPVPPARATASAPSAAMWSAPVHTRGQDWPSTAPTSVMSMLAMPPGLTNCVRPSRSSTTMQSRLEFRMRVFSPCASRSASADARASVMSRDTASSLSGRPSAPAMGVTCTSHQRGLPAIVGASPWKCPIPPAAAAAMAATTSACCPPCQESCHGQPCMAAKPSTSMLRWPPSLMNSRRPCRSSTLMQSPEDSRTLRTNSESACCASAAFCAGPARKIRMKPCTASASSSSGISSQVSQTWEPSLCRCHLSSTWRPCCKAAALPLCGTLAAQSSGVKNKASGWPSASASVQPRMAQAPALQAVTAPWGSRTMMASSVVLPTRARKSGRRIDGRVPGLSVMAGRDRLGGHGERRPGLAVMKLAAGTWSAPCPGARGCQRATRKTRPAAA